MFNIAILVLLYNKEISESKTLSSLISSEAQFSTAKLVIWNNGPEKLASYDVSHLTGLGYEVQIEETINNESLAVIYNRFIENIQSEKYVLLDDDSVLNDNYIKAANGSKNSEVSMPIITSGGRIVNPKINTSTYVKGQSIASNDKVITIGSGLVVGREIVLKLLNNFSTVFDERFYLYGVDTTFCYRLVISKLIKNVRVIHGFEHSLSRLEHESESLTAFRRKERSYDVALTYRYYYPIHLSLISINRIILSAIKNYFLSKKSKVYVYHLVKGFITGIHYRHGG